MNRPPLPKASQASFIKTAVRLPPSLHQELQDAAEKNGRSMNAEILARLQSLPVAEQLEKIAKDVAELKSLDREILSALASR